MQILITDMDLEDRKMPLANLNEIINSPCKLMGWYHFYIWCIKLFKYF